MNIVQVGDKLRGRPISILRSEDIVTLLSKVNILVSEEQKISASSTGDDLYKLFNTSNAEVQAKMLEDIFSAKREAIILSTIIEENNKQERKDDVAQKKWGSVQGSILLIAAAILIAIVWSFVSQHATKPPIPDAVIGNMVTELLRHGVDMLIAYIEGNNT